MHALVECYCMLLLDILILYIFRSRRKNIQDWTSRKVLHNYVDADDHTMFLYIFLSYFIFLGSTN
jgi:hypothetical protein